MGSNRVATEKQAPMRRLKPEENEFVDNGAPPNGDLFTRGWGVDGRRFGRADR